jgi:N-acetylneuraminate synthase/sialic acid synthase
MFKSATKDGEPFVIAEVGQNHQGNLEVAREYIKVFAAEGANAVKFQTRDNKYLFARDAYEMEYHSENAFANTYGQHREYLELQPEWLPILKEDCVNHGVLFMSTPFDEPSLDLLLASEVDILKIASFDLGNLPLIDLIAKSAKPVVLSTGGGNLGHVQVTVKHLDAVVTDLAVLHCVSEYPCEYNRLGLDMIEVLSKEFPDCVIGSSDHFNGTLSGPIAYMKGARVFEKHVTLNRSWKGTDHSFALEREGFRRFVRDIKRVRFMLPPKNSVGLGEEPVFQKLGKSVIAKSDISLGEVITIEKMSGRIFQQQFVPVRDSANILGKIASRKINSGEPISYEDVSGPI